MKALGYSALLAISLLSAASAASEVETSLLKDIKTAQQALRQTESDLMTQQTQLNKQYQALLVDVEQLRQQTAVARRAEDERTLGLDQLQQRLRSWQDSQRYQQTQLSSFLRQHAPDSGATTLPQQLSQLQQLNEQWQQRLRLQWQDQQIILPGGELSNARVLQAGPVNWYWLPQSAEAGLLSKDKPFRVAVPFADDAMFVALEQQHRAAVPLDPSLDKAVRRQQQQESWLAHVYRGGVWVVPILLFALLAVAIALQKAWQLLRLPAVPAASSLGTSPAAVHSPAAALQRCAKQFAAGLQRDDALFAELSHSKAKLDARLGAIAITAAVAPLLGLLGTVSGMIETFNMMTLFGSGDPQVVSGGIAQALITTELGLVVAIPSLVLHALLSRKARSYYQQLETLALSLSQQNNLLVTAEPQQEQAA